MTLIHMKTSFISAHYIDYSRLNFTHKTMMKLLYKKAVNLPEENGRS